MSFAHSSLFWLGLIVAGAVWAGYCYSARQRRKLLERFASPRLLEELTASVSPARRSAKQWLVIASIILLFAALARPQAGYTWQEAKRRGHDIMFAVDTSRSMLTPDMSPNRLTRAKLAILDTLEKLDGDRVGLIAFAGGAFLQCPLTIDYNAFRQTVEALDTNTIPRGGTDLAGAIKEAIGAMAGSQGDKTLIILTDGEETEGNALQFARQAAEKGIRIFTVGVGTPSGAVIPLRNPDGSTGLVRDPAGQPVRSRLNETLLKQIAETTGGFYIQLTAQSRGLQEILSDGLGNVEKQEIAEKMTRVPIDRFQIPLALAILLLLIEFILSERRKRLPLLTLPGGGRKTAALLLLGFFAFGYSSLMADSREAARLYQEGKFEEAGKLYESAATKNPKDARLHFNAGAAAYRAGDLDAAESHFQATLKTEDIPLQQKAYYNLGNTFYRRGEPLVQKEPKKTIELWEESLKAYEKAMELDASDENARFNHDLVKRRLEELKKQQEQNQQNNQQNQNQQDQKKDDSKKDQQQQQNQNDQNKNQDQQNQQGQDQPKDQDGQQDKNQQDQQQKKDSSGDQQKDRGQDQKQNQDSQGQDQKKDSGQDQKDQGQNQKDDKGKPDKQDGQEKQDQDNQDGSKDGEKPQPAREGDEEGVGMSPGQLNKQQAIQLLDSLKDGERKMPVFLDKPQNQNEPLKDW